MRLPLVASACLVLLAADGLADDAAPAEKTDAWMSWSRRFAESLEAKGRFDDAIDEWIALSRMTPYDIRPLAHAAVLAVDTPDMRGEELYLGSRNVRVAESCIREGLARGVRNDPWLNYALGRIRFAEKKWGPAWRLFSEAMEMGYDPVVVRYWYYRAAVN